MRSARLFLLTGRKSLPLLKLLFFPVQTGLQLSPIVVNPFPEHVVSGLCDFKRYGSSGDGIPAD